MCLPVWNLGTTNKEGLVAVWDAESQKKCQTRGKTYRIVYKGLCLLILSDVLILK
jgi:hypothetical protein